MATSTTLSPRERLNIVLSMAGAWMRSGRYDDALAAIATFGEDLASEIERLEQELQRFRGKDGCAMANRQTVVDASISQEQLFIGIDEDNDWERETFGYFWPLTEENKRGIEVVLEAAEKMTDERYGYCPYKFSGPYTEAELAAINSASRNTYMSRANIVTHDVNWDDLVRQLEAGDDPLYKGNAFSDFLRTPKPRQRA